MALRVACWFGRTVENLTGLLLPAQPYLEQVCDFTTGIYTHELSEDAYVGLQQQGR